MKIKISKPEFVRLQKKYQTDEAIGKALGVTRQRIHQIRIGYGILPLDRDKIRRKFKRTALRKKKIPAAKIAKKKRVNAKISKAELTGLIKKFTTDSNIGKALGLTRGRINQLRVFYGLASSWADKQKRNAKIIALQNNGATLQSIADKMGISIRQILRILYLSKKASKKNK